MADVLLTVLGPPIAGLLIALVVAIVLRVKHGVPLDPAARALALLGSLPLLAAFVAPPVLAPRRRAESRTSASIAVRA